MPRLSKKRFFKWARAHAGERILRASPRTCNCPVARYAESEGFKWPRVSLAGLSSEGGFYAIPSWAHAAVDVADDLDDTDRIADLLYELRKRGIRP